MAVRHLRDYTLEDVHQVVAPDTEPAVPRLEPALRPRRAPKAKAAPRPCEFCEALDARRYLLLASPKERRPRDMVVCRFCYVRLAGVVPHRSQLVRSATPANANDPEPDPAGTA